MFLHLPPALTRPRARGQGRHQDCGEGGWGHPRPAGAASHGSQGAGKGPERIPRTKRIALTLLRPGRSHAHTRRPRALPCPACAHVLARGCHSQSGKPIYFPPRRGLVFLVRCGKPINHQRSLRASISQEACHPPAAIPSAGKLPAAGAGRGARPAATPGGAGGGARMFAAPRGPEIYAGPSRSLPCALKSCGSGPGWGWGSQASSPRVLRVLIFAARPHCSYSGRF